jgi:CRP-like cAMP-binding protein
MTAEQTGRPTDNTEHFDHTALIVKYPGASVSSYPDRETIYTQGDPGDAVFYVASGRVKVTILSEHGKEAVIAFLGPGDFFGEGCLDEIVLRQSTITTSADSQIARFDRKTFDKALREDPAFTAVFLNFVLHRNQSLQADLVDHLFNSSEKRLARVLLTLASAGLSEQTNLITIPITQETLASMVGTTRSRINQFMTKFRKLGYLEYNGQIRVHNSLLSIILNERRLDEAS